MAPGYDQLSFVPEVLFKLGSALRAADRPREAVEAFQRAVKSRPGFAEAYNEMGCVLKSLGRADVAIKAFGRAVKAKPDYADAYNNLGNVLRAADRLDDAVLAYRRAVDIKPDFDAALFSLSAALLDKGDARALVEVCDACLARDPGNRRMLSSKAVALNELGDRDGVRFLLDFDRFIRATRVEAPGGFDNLAGFNGELARQVCCHPTLEYERTGHATRFGQHTGDLLLEAEGAIALLEGMMEGAVRDYVGALPADPSHPFLANPPARWRLTAWAVVMDKGGHQLPHIHSAAWLSGVYYVRLPNIGGLPEQGQAGWIQFGRPQPDLRCTAEPETRRLRPEEGLMYLFPSYFYHDTVPIETEERRISIAFDVLARN